MVKHLLKPFSLTSVMITSVVLVHFILAPLLYSVIVTVYKNASSEIFITQSHNIAGILSDDLSNKDLRSTDEIISVLDSAVLGGNILFIDIINNIGLTIKPYDQLSILADQFQEDTQLNQHNDTVYFISVPIYLRGAEELSHQLRIGFDESVVNDQIQTIKQRIIIIMLIYVLLMVSVFALITYYIHHPLKLLSRTSASIAEGEVNYPLQVNTRIKDIRDLARDLEKMRVTLLDMAKHMQVQATHDELTGLPNRYLYTDRMHQAVSLGQRFMQKFAVLLLDLDRFKEINDTLGHGIGDKVLKVLSHRMLKGMRESDTIARIGGDEFSIILINVDQQAAETIARKTVKLIKPIIDIDGHSLTVTASIGIAIYPDHGDNPELLLQHADVAMYHAKHNHRTVSSYHPDMDSNNYENLMLVNDFKSSIAQNHFVSFFQPKIDLATGKASGCEMLLRWRHPYLGTILPDKFIPLAEQENLIGELTHWATQECLIKFREILRIRPDFQVAINVSPVNLLDSKLLKVLLHILEQSHFPTRNFSIEITENVIMKNPERSAQILNKFHNAGIKISVDDFGTGYSSLAYLQKFPITELKIDKSFITDLSATSNNFPIVKASIAMAHDLGINVVAEGIENKEVHDLLLQMGCDLVQGYYYCKPLPIEELKHWLQEEEIIQQIIAD